MSTARLQVKVKYEKTLKNESSNDSHTYLSEAQCNTFVFANEAHPYNVTFTTDKILLKSSTRDDLEGTLDKGPPGSLTYEGEVIFTDFDFKKYRYVFYLRSSSFYWTLDGKTYTTSKWLNGIPIECTLPGKRALKLLYNHIELQIEFLKILS